MKIPQDAEEYLVWPPVAISFLAFVAYTVRYIISHLNNVLTLWNYSLSDKVGALVFPLIFGSVLAFFVKPKYWLAFIWFSVLGYIATLCLVLSPVREPWASIFAVSTCSVLMLSVQGGVMWHLRKIQLKNESA